MIVDAAYSEWFSGIEHLVGPLNSAGNVTPLTPPLRAYGSAGSPSRPRPSPLDAHENSSLARSVAAPAVGGPAPGGAGRTQRRRRRSLDCLPRSGRRRAAAPLIRARLRPGRAG